MEKPPTLILIVFFVTVIGFPLHGSEDPSVSSATNSTIFGQKRYGPLVDKPHIQAFHDISHLHHSPTKAPTWHTSLRPAYNVLSPSTSSFRHPFNKKWKHGSAFPPLVSPNKHHKKRIKFRNISPEPYNQLHPPYFHWQGPSISPLYSPFPSPKSWGSPTPAPSTMPSSPISAPAFPPTVSPLGSLLKRKRDPVLALPPPPPNADCTSLKCTEPFTYAPAGSPCGCVWPIEVRLHLSVALYMFFPLVTELAREIAVGFSLNRSQVRIMGANAATQQLETTIVLINLVPLKETFDPSIAFLIYKKFWKRKVSIKSSLFGTYEVVYVHYPGLPPSPPTAPSTTASMVDHPYPGNQNDGRTIKPLGLEVPRRRKGGISRSMIILIILLSVTAFVVFMGFLCLLLLKCQAHPSQTDQFSHTLMPSHGKPSGVAAVFTFGRRSSSVSLSFSSGVLTYTGNAKVFSLSDIEKATDTFDSSRILGEGGFGLVYSGILEDGRQVAVKVLKRDDRRGGREFLAEVEMLSRLHHRNLVKLIGICTEDNSRCLIYELVPNGSVESHLHGVDKESVPLSWDVRMKIALGAARGLAYLHEDSSPCVIHRDFKSSNILLEYDYTPKVSDFGLARAALDEGNKHISTHVMGTFGYLAPEYAMTGHLLVKSDVYSYGVVLLELLTGRKPVDLSQPPGQENLVAWARPLLTSKDGLETIIDPALNPYATSDSIAKVAAVASMCVQPEVSHRPFMGEVVQALKLVYNEFEEAKVALSRTCSESIPIDIDSKHSRASGELPEASCTDYPMTGYDSTFESGISASDLRSVSVGFEKQECEYFRKEFKSAPLRMGKRRQFWQRLRGMSRGSMSEHGKP